MERPFGDDFEPANPLTLDLAVNLHPFTRPLLSAGLPALPELAKGLSSPSTTTRQVCAWVLDNFVARETVEAADFNEIRAPLLAGLRDDDSVVRFCLVNTIGAVKLRGAEAYLLKLLETPVSETSPAVELPRNSLPAATQIQVAVIRALFYFPSDRVRDALLRALEHPNPAVRAAAAGHLGQFPAEFTVGPLLKALADPGAAAEAARVLGHVGDPRAISSLIELLKSSDSPIMRANAAQSLGLLGAADARSALRDVLEQIPADSRKSERFGIQVAAAVSLVQLQDEAGTARLKELLENPDPQTRYAAASRLNLATGFSEWRPPARLTHEPTRALMRQFAEHAPDTPTRLQLFEALRGQFDQPTREFLERRGNDPNEPLRWAAWRTLARPNPAAYETQLLSMLDDSDDRTRREIVFLLAQIATPRVTDRLLTLTAAGDDELRVAVVILLAKHRSPAVDARLRDLAANDPCPHVRVRAAKSLAASTAGGK
jgi:HEAT repeat protein